MATYAFRNAAGDIERLSPFGKPPPAHTLTPAAEEAREAMRRHGARKIVEREAGLLVTDHGRPHVEPYTPTKIVRTWRTTKKGKKKLESETIVPADVRPAAAIALEKKAAAAGWKTNLFTTPGDVRTVVEGRRDRQGFRAVWLRGRAESGTWHEPWRYAMIHDTRPVGVAKITRTALAGKRGAGMGENRRAIGASPGGSAVGVSESSTRVSTT